MTERAEQDSAVEVRALGEARAGSAIRDRAKGTVPWGRSRQCHGTKQGNAIRISAMGTAQGSAIRVSVMGTVPWG